MDQDKLDANENVVKGSAAKSNKRVIKLKLKYVVTVIAIIGVLTGVMYFLTVGQAGQALSIVASGDNVSVFYTLTLTNGTVLQSNFGGRPFSFVVGGNSTIKGFNNAVIGMSVGETKTVTLPPSEAYGYANQSEAILVPIIKIEETANVSNLRVGEQVSPGGGYLYTVTALNSTTATLTQHLLARPSEIEKLLNVSNLSIGEEFNYGRDTYNITALNSTAAILYAYPTLAGDTLVFKIEVASINS